jgi:inorganic triphosphatase YgiF
MTNEGGAIETEIAFVFSSGNAQRVRRHIADLTSIDKYQLLPQNSESLHDRYFDSPRHDLRAKGFALRLREIDKTPWITLKGPSKSTDWGGVERLEIEVPWSQDALNGVLEKLSDSRIKLQHGNKKPKGVEPLDAMMGLGLRVVQDRQTHRQIRNVVIGEGSPVLAELAIDSVVYHFTGQEVLHYELEIEAKVEDGSTVLKAVIASLVAIHGYTLRRWDHSKLATGMAIEELLGEEGAEGLLDVDNHLKPSAYDRIDDRLKRRRL